MRAVGGLEAHKTHTHEREAATVVYQFRIGSFAQEKQTWATVHPKRLCTFFRRCAQRKRFPQPGVKCERSRRLQQKAARGIINANSFLLF